MMVLKMRIQSKGRVKLRVRLRVMRVLFMIVLNYDQCNKLSVKGKSRSG